MLRATIRVAAAIPLLGERARVRASVTPYRPQPRLAAGFDTLSASIGKRAG